MALGREREQLLELIDEQHQRAAGRLAGQELAGILRQALRRREERLGDVGGLPPVCRQQRAAEFDRKR
jgi:hypothetical protein